MSSSATTEYEKEVHAPFHRQSDRSVQSRVFQGLPSSMKSTVRAPWEALFLLFNRYRLVLAFQQAVRFHRWGPNVENYRESHILCNPLKSILPQGTWEMFMR